MAMIPRRILSNVPSQLRCASSNAEIKPILTNRNPRNLEKLRIAYKPDGYHLEKPGRCYWHKLELETSVRYVKASVSHFENGSIISASTQEWPIKKQLYRYNDASAFVNLGRILAQRCLEFGITEIRSDIAAEEGKPEGKVALFLKSLQDGGVVLEEPTQYKKPRPWDQHRPDKPWDVSA